MTSFICCRSRRAGISWGTKLLVSVSTPTDSSAYIPATQSRVAIPSINTLFFIEKSLSFSRRCSTRLGFGFPEERYAGFVSVGFASLFPFFDWNFFEISSKM